MLKKVHKDKEREISLLRKQVCQAKKDEETEFRNSEISLLSLAAAMLMASSGQCLFLDLDMSQVSLDDVAQTPAKSIKFKGTNELFEDDPTP